MSSKNSLLEKRLWDAADLLRANSKLTSTQYSMPVLGLIFLRHAYNRYLVVAEEIKKTLPLRNGIPREVTKDDFKKKSAMFLRTESQYDYMLNLHDGSDIAKAVITAMDLIEGDDESLKGVLPKNYNIFENDLLIRLIKIFNDDALKTASGDIFGRIYEYFLMKFAMSGAQDSGEFFTPVSLVQTIVNVIEPNHGTVFDPACGSGGMFVQSAHFIEEQGGDISSFVTFKGQEKTTETIRLAKMNLAVHGLEGKILEGNSFYQDEHEMYKKKADFVMANPPFNVDGVDADKVKTDPRLVFGLPGVNKKGDVSNGNYLWISYFYSYLNDTGRAGFVMSSQSSSAGQREKEVRRKIIESGCVDIIISIRSNFFYTRGVPCELWFFDKAKPKEKVDKVLMLDVRNIFRRYQDSRRIFEFSPEQLKNITAIVWLYRGQTSKYTKLIAEYLETIINESKLIKEKLYFFNNSVSELITYVTNFSKVIGKEKVKSLNDSLNELTAANKIYLKDFSILHSTVSKYITKYKTKIYKVNKDQHKASKEFESVEIGIKSIVKQIDYVYKLLTKTLYVIGKEYNTKENGEWDNKAVSKLIKESESSKKESVDQLKQPIYFHKQVQWLQLRFPDAKYEDVEGLVKLADKKEIENNDWSLTPGRYVGISPQIEPDDFNFEDTMKEIHNELEILNKESIDLAGKIKNSFKLLEI